MEVLGSFIMSNKLIIVIFVVILLGAAAGTPLYVLGKQKAEMESRILELEVTSTELGAKNEALQQASIQLEKANIELHNIESKQSITILALEATLAEQIGTVQTLQEQITELENTIDELQVTVATQSDATEEPQKQWGDETAHKAQELLDFATAGLVIWEALMDVSAELGNFCNMLIIGDMFYENEANNVLSRLQKLEQKLVRLDTPPDAVVLKDSLQSQYDLLELYFTKIILAWANIANQNVFNQYMSEASALYLNEFLPLAENNQRDLSEAIYQAEYEVNHT